MQRPLARVSTLTFDMFGTVLDLAGTLVPAVADFLTAVGAEADAASIWGDWRARQRLEQHQDTILMLGHTGYLDSARRALQHTLRCHRINYTEAAVRELLRSFGRLSPFADVQAGLLRLGRRYQLVALSNGDSALVEQLTTNSVAATFDLSLSVDSVGRFKPHPAVYRMAASRLGCEPAEIMMVAAHAFDILGARACGFRGAYVNRHGLPYEESALVPDMEVRDFNELADRLLGS